VPQTPDASSSRPFNKKSGVIRFEKFEEDFISVVLFIFGFRGFGREDVGPGKAAAGGQNDLQHAGKPTACRRKTHNDE
jgi:hypothetical protein